jgi:hypothetical protein
MSLKYKLTSKVFSEIGIAKNFASVEPLFKQMWHSTNTNNSYSLTRFGLECLAKDLKLKYWKVSIVLETISSAEIIMLSRYMNTPFYLHKFNAKKATRDLVVFDDNVAAQLLLYGGNLKVFLQAQDSASNNPVMKKK